MTRIRFAKGHGTENHFLILPDMLDEQEAPSPQLVATMCDRHKGLGADGVLRVARKEGMWFMDYYNADGSYAEMCGNGLRVFSHWLVYSGAETNSVFDVATRAGVKRVEVTEGHLGQATVRLDMGEVGVGPRTWLTMGALEAEGWSIDVGNPHLAAQLSTSIEELAEMTLCTPKFDTEVFPHGVNVEFFTPLNGGAIAMRVWERGVGETRSCGTGTVAAATAALREAGCDQGRVAVNVPGGRVTVEIRADKGTQYAALSGPSRIIATGELDTKQL